MPDTTNQYAALFAHVGVINSDDWRSVALKLAERYAPEVLLGVERKGPGRPQKWDALTEASCMLVIKQIQEASRYGTIRRNLSTLKAACQYLTEDTADARECRERAFIEEGTSFDALYNRMSALSKIRKGAAKS